jgi:hypothetical protein
MTATGDGFQTAFSSWRISSWLLISFPSVLNNPLSLYYCSMHVQGGKGILRICIDVCPLSLCIS